MLSKISLLRLSQKVTVTFPEFLVANMNETHSLFGRGLEDAWNLTFFMETKLENNNLRVPRSINQQTSNYSWMASRVRIVLGGTMTK